MTKDEANKIIAGAPEPEPEPCARCGRALRDRCWSHDGNLYCTESCMLADIRWALCAAYQFFTIERVAPPPGRKCATYTIRNRRDASIIGFVRWYPSWRQYCFFPTYDTAWSAGCLADVQGFLKQLKEGGHDN